MQKTIHDSLVAGSFRDPSGFLFFEDQVLYRQVNLSYKEHYRHLMDSGLYAALIERGLLIPHDESSVKPRVGEQAYLVLAPEKVDFIAYPYEWCFSQFKDAALTTLQIQKRALEKGMILKDASAYNIQRHRGNTLLIDTLSFEKYEEGMPWIAYKQFCQHFLAPLALMSFCDVRLNQLLRVYIDGIPLDLASTLLPRRTWLNTGILMHIHLHAKSQKHFSDKEVEVAKTSNARKMSRMGLLGLIDSLETAVKRLQWKPGGTEWADYYDQTNYSDDASKEKARIVDGFIRQVNPRLVWDMGANRGVYSRLASTQGIAAIAFDIDPAAVEKNYRESREKNETLMYPLVLDCTNPSPGIGWEHNERMALMDRSPADLMMALALVHHLAISNNLPLEKIARFFQKLGRHLIIEFVPKNDSQVMRLLKSREDIFPNYTQEGFEKAFAPYFETVEKSIVSGSQRILYLMRSL
ncbi:MAG: SAM-dependent methyltransferase [Candidatus Omnitrophica bacterium]|nr:SAM-dependent methyltransferase [Candidatus Omnitrophota bacterium]